jgi:4-hydroxybenzoate polyprenyltransferase
VLQVAREILKDAEDVETDRGRKHTVPLACGVEPARRTAHGLVAIVLGAMVATPHYWRIFSRWWWWRSW